MTPSEQKRFASLLDCARSIVATPNDMERRHAFLQRTFNLDRLAELLVAAHPAESPPIGSERSDEGNPATDEPQPPPNTGREPR